jgi:chromate transport protein ChrA
MDENIFRAVLAANLATALIIALDYEMWRKRAPGEAGPSWGFFWLVVFAAIVAYNWKSILMIIAVLIGLARGD